MENYVGCPDKVRNRLISGIRVCVEHAIGGVKRYRILQDNLRNWKPGFRDVVFDICYSHIILNKLGYIFGMS